MILIIENNMLTYPHEIAKSRKWNMEYVKRVSKEIIKKQENFFKKLANCSVTIDVKQK